MRRKYFTNWIQLEKSRSGKWLEKYRLVLAGMSSRWTYTGTDFLPTSMYSANFSRFIFAISVLIEEC